MTLLTGLGAIGLSCAAAASNIPRPPAANSSIPVALRGCWTIDEPQDEEHGRIRGTLIVSADRVIADSEGVGRREGRIELVERLGAHLIEGRITAQENGRPVTIATALILDPEDGTLLLREGDAGSYTYTRCSEATPARQRLSLVIAETGRQDDPRPAPCGPDGSCGDSLYRTTFQGARRVAGDVLPAAFEARLKLHTPLMRPTTLALIVERESDGSLLVLRRAGFNGRTGVACFGEPDEHPVAWKPSAPQVRWQKETLCVSDPRQIDPDAPHD